jgi:hypothetical protein
MSKFFRAAGAVMLAIITAASYVYPIPISILNRWGFLIFFAVFCAYICWYIWGLEKEIRYFRDARPNIALKRIEENFLGNLVTWQYSSLTSQWLAGKTEHPNFTRIWVFNDPLKPVQSVDAINLYGEITFYDNVGSRLFSMGGRWAETKQSIEGGQPIEMEQVTLSPNGKPFCMDIGLKYSDENNFYGYNSEPSATGGRDPNRELSTGPYYVKVRFRCKGVDKTFVFRLFNRGAGQDISFTETTQQPSLYVGGFETG